MQNKKFSIMAISALVIAAMISFAGVAVANHLSFVDEDDITPAHVDSIHEASSEGIVEGYSDGTVRPLDNITRQEAISLAMRARIDGSGIDNLEVDGPYPGATQLTQGSNSDSKWIGDEGDSLQESWVECADDKVALGGGFSRADEGATAFKNIQIVTSEPRDTSATVIDGDPDGSVVTTGWKVEGFNNGTTDLIVRPWVICAELTN